MRIFSDSCFQFGIYFYLKRNMEFDLETLHINKEIRKGKEEIYGCASMVPRARFVEVSPVDLVGGSWTR
jgi:hypothetical protein